MEKTDYIFAISLLYENKKLLFADVHFLFMLITTSISRNIFIFVKYMQTYMHLQPLRKNAR